MMDGGSGWRIDRIPAKPARREDGGRLVVPLWLLYDRWHYADLDLTLSVAEAETLRNQLSRALRANSTRAYGR